MEQSVCPDGVNTVSEGLARGRRLKRVTPVGRAPRALVCSQRRCLGCDNTVHPLFKINGFYYP